VEQRSVGEQYKMSVSCQSSMTRTRQAELYELEIDDQALSAVLHGRQCQMLCSGQFLAICMQAVV